MRAAIVLFTALGLATCGCSRIAGDERAAAVVKLAPTLQKDVKAANEKLKELADALQDANDKLGKKQYPSDLSGKIAALVIPFDAANLDHRALTDFPRDIVRALLDYTAQVQHLNTSMQAFKNLLVIVEPQVVKAWNEEKQPVVSYSVLLESEGGKPAMARLVPNKEPFKLDGEIPKRYVVVAPETVDGRTRAVDRQVTRWENRPVAGAEPAAVPVSPESMAFVSDKAALQLRLKLVQSIETLLGKDKGTPNEAPGLLELGKRLEADLELKVAK